MSPTAAERSRYQELPTARFEFSRPEIKHLRHLLRRLRFLERSLKESEGREAGGALFAEIESDALVWVLVEVGYLAEPNES